MFSCKALSSPIQLPVFKMSQCSPIGQQDDERQRPLYRSLPQLVVLVSIVYPLPWPYLYGHSQQVHLGQRRFDPVIVHHHIHPTPAVRR